MFNGEAIENIALAGIEHVISVQIAPQEAVAPVASGEEDPLLQLPVHIRAYTLSLQTSSPPSKVPYVNLVPMGPSIDMKLRRHIAADPVLLANSLKRPKLAKKDVESGLGDKKKMRNKEVDQMGDLRGKVHVPKQDLTTIRRTGVGKKALKGRIEENGDDVDMDQDDSGDEEESLPKKRRKA